jgi:hypothetical protein
VDLHVAEIVPSIDSTVAVISTAARPDLIVASMILWFIGQGHSGWVVSAPF